MNHRQVNCHLNGEDFTVDELLHTLLKTLWTHNFTTLFSCQGDQRWMESFQDRAYILFERTPELENFVAFLQTQHDGFKNACTLNHGEQLEDFVLYKRAERKNKFMIERDSLDGQARLCLRFPQKEISTIKAIAHNFAFTY